MNLIYGLGSIFVAWSLLSLLGGERYRRLEKLHADLIDIPPEPVVAEEEPIMVVGSPPPRA